MRRVMFKIEKPPVLIGVVAAICICISSPLVAQEASDRGRVDGSGFLGFELVCQECSQASAGGVVVWTFAQPPVVSKIRSDGPAARAGLNEGDTILAINGVGITTELGGQLFGAIRAGQPLTLTVRRGGVVLISATPKTRREVFGDWTALRTERWNELRAEVLTLSAEQAQLQEALASAEAALRQSEVQRASSGVEAALTEQLRVEIDSIRNQLERAQAMLKIQAESLAVRTLWVSPEGGEAEARTLTVYRNVVAGARFEELTEESTLAGYFPGVEGGLLIVEVVESTPAYAAGLRDGDVVQTVNGRAVKTVQELRRALSASRGAELGYVRRGEKKICKIGNR